MKVFFDTEFYEDGATIQLISLGAVREDGAEYYAETWPAHELAKSSDWLRANVAPYLTSDSKTSKSRPEIAKDLLAFAGEKPQWWAYYADYDWVVLCQLFGRMIDLPKGWPMYCRDLKQLMDEQEARYTLQLPEKPANVHNALADAQWVKRVYDYLMQESCDRCDYE